MFYKVTDDGRENEIRRIATEYMKKKNYKSPRIVEHVVALYKYSAWSANELKNLVTREIDQTAKTYDAAHDATNIIAQKNGYILAVNREGTVVLAFPGEDPNSNPHMYLGKADKAENIEAGKRMLHKMADTATCDALYKVDFKVGAKGAIEFDTIFADNEKEAIRECVKRYSKGNQKAIVTNVRKMHDSALKIDPITGFLVKDAKDKKKTADYAFENSDVVKCAKYLWTWDDSLEVQRKIFDKCMRESGAKTREEAIQYAKTVYKKELDAFYSQLKREVEKMLKAGYDKGLKEGMNA